MADSFFWLQALSALMEGRWTDDMHVTDGQHRREDTNWACEVDMENLNGSILELVCLLSQRSTGFLLLRVELMIFLKGWDNHARAPRNLVSSASMFASLDRKH